MEPTKDDSYGGKAFLLAVLMTVLSLVIFLTASPVNSGKYRLGYKSVFDIESQASETASSSEKDIANREQGRSFMVISATDGDTIKIDYFGSEESIRMIGVNTPEVDSPYTTAQCYGKEASAFTKEKLEGKYVEIRADNTQDNRDKYNRLLRYVSLDGEDFGGSLIMNGYAYEYTYNKPYEKQGLYQSWQDYAAYYKKGLWGVEGCAATSEAASNETKEEKLQVEHSYGVDGDCNIKGNISYNTGEKIYHVPGQENYDATVINTDYGERWFCSEEEARAAGWRRANEPITGTIEYRDSDGNKIDVDEDGSASGDQTNSNNKAGYREVEDKVYYGELVESGQTEEEATTTNRNGWDLVRTVFGVVYTIILIFSIVVWAYLLKESIGAREVLFSIISVILLVVSIMWTILVIRVVLASL